MNGYSIPVLDNDYLSTLLAGTLGMIFVFVITLILGTMITKHNQTKNWKT
jgi:hypothetical protein